jgi:hypothetical protein
MKIFKDISFWCIVLGVVVIMVVHHILSHKSGIIEGQQNDTETEEEDEDLLNNELDPHNKDITVSIEVGMDPDPTPVNCQGNWSAWGECNKECGGGQHSRTYTVNQVATNGGIQCPFLNNDVENGDCNIQSCQPEEALPVDADAAADTAADAVADTAADTVADTAADAAADTAADTVADTAVDTAADTAVDTAVDTAADTAVDTAVDTDADTDADADADADGVPDWCSDLCYIGEGPGKCYLANTREKCEGAYFVEGTGTGKKCHWNGSRCVFPGGTHNTTVNCPQTACPVGSGNSLDGVINGMCGTSSEDGYVSISDMNNCMTSLGNLEWEKRGGGENKREFTSWDAYEPGGRLDINRSGLNNTTGPKPFFDDICKSFGYNESIIVSPEYGEEIDNVHRGSGRRIITIQPQTTSNTPENRNWTNWVWNGNGSGRGNYTKIKCAGVI